MKKWGVRKVDLLPSGNYRARASYVDLAGKRHFRSFTAQTQSEAVRAAEDFELDMRKNAPDKKNLTVRNMIDQYIAQKTNVLSPSTIRSYKLYLHKRMKNILDIPIRNLTDSMLQKEIDRESGEVGPKTIRNVYGLFFAAVSNYDKSLKFNVRLPAKTRKIYPLPTAEEIQAFLSAVEGTNFEIPVLIALYLGLRVSEIRGLRYGDIKGSQIIIHATLVPDDQNRLVEKKNTKNETSTRILNIPPFLLNKIKEKQGDKADNDYIIDYQSMSFSNMMRRYCEKAKIRNIRFHDFRHVFASAMLRLNIPDKYAMQLGGWASPSIMKTVYQHTMADYVSEANEQVTQYIDQMIGRKS